MTTENSHRQLLADLVRLLLESKITVSDFVHRTIALWMQHRDATWTRDAAVTQKARELEERRLKGELSPAEFGCLYSSLWGFDKPGSDIAMFDEFHALCVENEDSEPQEASADFVDRARSLARKHKLDTL